MITPASVLLPEPFGPISACVSPRRIVRFTPLRIGLPSTATCRFLIFKCFGHLLKDRSKIVYRRRCDSVFRTQYTESFVCNCHQRSAIRRLRHNLLMIEQRLAVGRRRNISAVVRHGQLVVDLHADRCAALPRNLVSFDFVLDPHQPF